MRGGAQTGSRVATWHSLPTTFLCLLAASCTLSAPLRQLSATNEAYATLLYGDDFLLAVRVLGQSLVDTGSTRDRVVISAGHLSDYAQETLQADGWLLHRHDPVVNPSTRDDGAYPPRFWAVYTKLYIFSLVQYTTIVFLDADTIAVASLDELFRCPGFCAVLRHSERFNSGVMVLRPSMPLFEDMLGRISSTTSYTGGDQGFLNAYFTDFIDGPLFHPDSESVPDEDFLRLPTTYNADIGLYVFNSNRWLLSGPLKVVHYTLGSFKPWNWWCGWLVVEQSRWNRVRMRLGPDAYGRRHGLSFSESFAQRWLPLLPPLICLVILRCAAMGVPPQLSLVSAVPSSLPRTGLDILSVAMGYFILLMSAFLAWSIIPAAVTPSWGWILAYEYFFLFFGLLYGKWLHIVWSAGRLHGGASLGKAGASTQPWRVTAVHGVTLAAMLLTTPFLDKLFGIPGFVNKILCTIGGGLITNTVATRAFGLVAAAWYNAI